MITTLLLFLAIEPGAVEVAPAEPTGAVREDTSLPPEARQYNERGVALVVAGQYEAGIAELEHAYASMKDPLKYRAARGKVMGSLRSALQQYYAASGATVHLCRLRELLRWHRSALLAALGPTGRNEDVAGTDEAVRQVDAAIGARSCEERPRAVVAPPPAPTTPPPVRPAPHRRLRIAGSMLIGVGFSSLGVMTFGLIAMADNRHKLQNLTTAVESGRRPPSDPQQTEAVQLYERAADRRNLAIAMGVVGGVAVLTGMALRIAGRSRSRVTAGLTPVFAPGFAGLAGRVVF